MARRTADVTIPLKNRDEGKKFRITELPAEEAEEWAARMIAALAKNGVEIPDEVMESPSLAGIAYVTTKSLGKIAIDDAMPLFRQMMKCLVYVDKDSGLVRALNEGPDGDIEEVATRLYLRGEVISLHLGFSMYGAIKEWREAMALENLKKAKTSGRHKTRPRR